MKKVNILLTTFIVFISVFSISVSANSPAPPRHLTFEFTNVPENVVFADLLIQIKNTDQNYTLTNELINDELSTDSEIAAYDLDGYRSFSFHYKNAKSITKLYKANYLFPNEHQYYYADFAKGSESEDYLTQYEDLLSNYNKVKIAFIDVDGKIVSVSEEFKLPSESNIMSFRGTIKYDYQNGEVDTGAFLNPYFVVFLVFLIGVSVGIEIIISIIFKFTSKQIEIVLIVNVITQIIMRVLYFVLPFPYIILTVALEVFIYLIEFLIFTIFIKEQSKNKLLMYTIIANTASLVLGLLIINFLGL